MENVNLWQVKCPSCSSERVDCADYAPPALDNLRRIIFKCPDCGLEMYFYPGGIPGINTQGCINMAFQQTIVCKCGQHRLFQAKEEVGNVIVLSVCPSGNGCGQVVVGRATSLEKANSTIARFNEMAA
jgi:predicted RNA-binding Zn-ribbon protein involved in translation (DUF1610 family)